MDSYYFTLSQENPPDPEPASTGSQDTYMDPQINGFGEFPK